MVSLKTLAIPFLAEMAAVTILDLFLLRSISEKAEKWMRLNCDTTTIAHTDSVCAVMQGTNYGGNQGDLGSPQCM